MNGIQEVSGSIPLSSTKKIKGLRVTSQAFFVLYLLSKEKGVKVIKIGGGCLSSKETIAAIHNHFFKKQACFPA